MSGCRADGSASASVRPGIVLTTETLLFRDASETWQRAHNRRNRAPGPRASCASDPFAAISCDPRPMPTGSSPKVSQAALAERRADCPRQRGPFGQTSVDLTPVSMSSMDHHLPHSAETDLSARDLAALQALAEPNRVRIVELLSHGEHCVCDVGGALGLSVGLVSHHLRVLRESGLVNERRDGRWVHYALDIERFARLRAAVVALITPSEAALLACPSSGCGLLSRRRDGVTPKPLEAASSRR